MKLDWRNSLLQIFLTNFLSAPHEDLREGLNGVVAFTVNG